MSLTLLVLAGLAAGVLIEYGIHRFLHVFRIKAHTEHHKEFFQMEPAEVARRSHPLLEYGLYALLVFAGLSPLALLIGLAGYLCLYAGIFIHLMIIYQICHFILHYDGFLPGWIRARRLYRWWRDCHTEHHWHKPRRNYCVTVPLVDWIFGTYVHPTGRYRPVPVQRKQK